VGIPQYNSLLAKNPDMETNNEVFPQINESKFKAFNEKIMRILGILSGNTDALQKLGFDRGIAKIFRNLI
jgi:hypothetical protein